MLFLAEVVLVDVEHFDRSLDPHADLVAHHQVNQCAPVDQDNLGLDVVIYFPPRFSNAAIHSLASFSASAS